MEKIKSIARDYGSPYLHNTSYLEAALKVVGPMLGTTEDNLIEYRGRQWRFCVPEGGFDKSGKIVLEKLKDKKFFDEVVKRSVETASAVEAYAEALNKIDPRKLSAGELYGHYKKLYELHVEMNVWGHIVNLADFEHFMLSHKILAFLEKRTKTARGKITAAEAFAILATSTKRSKLQQQDLDFFNLLVKIQSDAKAEKIFKGEPVAILKQLAKFPEISEAIAAHAEKYKWLQFHYDGPTILDELYFVEALASALRQGTNGAEKAAELVRHEKEIAVHQKKLVIELKLSSEEQHWAEVARSFAFLKGLRKETIFEANANYFPLLKEIGRRLQLASRQVRFMTLQEVEKALQTGKVDSVEVNKRIQLSITRLAKGAYFYTGKEAEKIASQIYEEEFESSAKEVQGTPAYPGSVKGVVKIIVGAEDMKKFNAGDILVSPATNPNLVSIMKIAGAIVTDEGGITCHAAIVSRELKVPCVIGTKVATKWLKDGDKVEVDATKGIVKKIT